MDDKIKSLQKCAITGLLVGLLLVGVLGYYMVPGIGWGNVVCGAILGMGIVVMATDL